MTHKIFSPLYLYMVFKFMDRMAVYIRVEDYIGFTIRFVAALIFSYLCVRSWEKGENNV